MLVHIVHGVSPGMIPKFQKADSFWVSLLQAERVNRTWKSKLMYDLEHH